MQTHAILFEGLVYFLTPPLRLELWKGLDPAQSLLFFLLEKECSSDDPLNAS